MFLPKLIAPLSTYQSRPATSGVFYAVGNASGSCLRLMTLDTQMSLALLQELLMA